AEHEKCGDSSDMENTEGDAIGPVNFLWRVSDVDQVGDHVLSPGMNRLDRWINTTGSRWAGRGDAGSPATFADQARSKRLAEYCRRSLIKIAHPCGRGFPHIGLP